MMLYLWACDCLPDSAHDEPDTGNAEPCPDNAWIQLEAGALLSCGLHEGGCAECWGNTAFAYEIAETREFGPMDTGWRHTDYGDDDPPNIP